MQKVFVPFFCLQIPLASAVVVTTVQFFKLVAILTFKFGLFILEKKNTTKKCQKATERERERKREEREKS